MTAHTPTSILYHADCLDGFGAAYAAWRRFGSAARYCPMHHGAAWDMTEIAGHTVYILDFSFPPETLERMAKLAHAVIQIDHHASACQAWADKLLPADDGSHSFHDSSLPLSVIFHLGKSGARLAWEYFHEAPVPLALAHIEDQDLWRFALPATRPFCRALRLLPFELETWDAMVQATATADTPRYLEMLGNGQAIEQFFQKEVERLAHGTLPSPARLRGEPVDALQATRHGLPIISDNELSWRAIEGIAINTSALFSSELGHQLAQQSGTFGLIWQLAADGEAKVSLRSEGGFDVAEIASRYGGGGHRNAAGFRMPVARFMAEVLGLG